MIAPYMIPRFPSDLTKSKQTVLDYNLFVGYRPFIDDKYPHKYFHLSNQVNLIMQK